MAAAASQLSQAQVAQQAQLMVLKKAMELSEAGALQLLEAVPQPSTLAAADPGQRLGATIDVRV